MPILDYSPVPQQLIRAVCPGGSALLTAQSSIPLPAGLAPGPKAVNAL